MPTELDPYVTEVRTLLKDDGNKLDDDNDIKPAIKSAARWYSNFDKRQVVGDLDSDGTGDFDLADLDGYTDKFSEIISVEWPISAAGERQRFLEEKQFKIIRLTNKLVLRVFRTVATGDKVRVNCTAPHVIDDATNTLPDEAFNAVSEYAAANCCDKLANNWAPTIDKAPQLDLGGFRDLTSKYTSRAKTHRANAAELLDGFVFV